MCQYIRQDILNKDNEKVKPILSLYNLPKIKIEYYPIDRGFLNVKLSYSIFHDSLDRIREKLNRKETLSKNDYNDIDNIFNIFYKEVPPKLKDMLINNIDEEYKKHFLEENKLKIFEKYYKDSDFWKRYEPRLNGIPIESLALTEEQIEKFLTCNDDEVSDVLKDNAIYSFIIFVKTISYFHSFLVPEYLKKRIQYLDTYAKNNNTINIICEECDKNTLKEFEKRSTSIRKKG